MSTYRTWHISNPPNNGSRRVAASPAEGRLMLSALSYCDLYLDDLIAANAQGLGVKSDDGEWEDSEGRYIGEDDTEAEP